MKNLILVLITIFSMSSFAGECTAGDKSCETSQSEGGANVLNYGFNCPGCKAQELAHDDPILEVNPRTNAGPATSAAGAAAPGKVKTDQ